MSRRKVVALVSAAFLLAVSVGVVAFVVALTQTGTGQDYVRRLVRERLAPSVHGKLYVGRVSGGFLDGVTIDSVELRGEDDSLFVATGPIRVWYDVRDLVDKRVLLKRVEVEHPTVRIAQRENGRWNYKEIFPPGPKRSRSRVRAWGDFIVADSVRMRGGTFLYIQAWHPADSLRGARRDSAIAYNVARRDATIRRRADGLARTYTWRGIDLALSQLSLSEPDSGRRYAEIARLNTDESDPPFRWRNIRGTVRQQGDSVWAAIPHFDLPASTGSARARVTWGSGLPTRYDAYIVADSMALADIAWVYPTLPRTGGGTTELHLFNDPRNLRVLQYALSKLDVRTTQSHLTGAMTFAVGGPVLAVKDVEVRAEPIDWELLRVFNGKPFPYNFAGTLTGTVRARGGPVNRFVVDDARLTWADGNVSGAVSQFAGRGQLDILFPAYTRFRGFDLDVQRLDLRTPRALNASFPPLLGTVDGRARLDSLWLDVRVSNADVTHRDGTGEPSRFTGGGRVTIGDEFLLYDLALQAQPVSLTTLARSYPDLAARGSFTGPMTLRGTIDSLLVTTTLTGDAGTFTFDGLVDDFEPSLAVRGRGTVTTLDLRTLRGGSPAVPVTQLTGSYDADVRGTSLADLAGRLSFDLARSAVAGTRVYDGTARLAFGDGRVRADSLAIDSPAFRLVARGALGLAAGATDTMRLTVVADSLGGLRRWLGGAAGAGSASAPDSLSGVLRLAGTLAGTLDTSATSAGLTLDGRLRGDNLVLRGVRTSFLDGTVRVADALRHPFVSAALGADSLAVGRLALGRADATYATDSAATREMAAARAMSTSGLVADGGAGPAAGRVTAGRFTLRAASDSGPSITLAGSAATAPDTTRVTVDSARLGLAAAHAYRLTAPSTVTLATANNTIVLDPFTLRDEIGAQLSVRAALGDTGAVSGALVVERLPLADLARLGGLVGGAGTTQFDGRLDLRAALAGTRAEPTIELAAATGRVQVAGVAIDSSGIAGRYVARRVAADMTLFRGGRSLLAANAALPLDLALTTVADRRLTAPLQGALRADSLDLALLGALVPGTQNVAGVVRASAELGGTWERPRLLGAVRLRGGAGNITTAGVRFENITADVALTGDTLRVDSLVVRSAGTARLAGSVAIAPVDNPSFDLRFDARNFLAVDRPRFATLWLSTPTPVTLTGRYLGATVRGAVRADRGRIYIPELIEKRIVDLSDYADVVDTSSLAVRSLLPGTPSRFVENVRVEDVSVSVGDDVWLRSPEANIKLGGSLAVTRARATTLGGESREQLALRGALAVERGTYRLSLPPIAQPIFEVQPGTLRFFGTPDLNPTLDIRAVHTVRQPGRNTNRPDVRVQVAIGGTLNSPSLALSSPDDPSIATTDLISYLVTGEPAAVILGQQGAGSGAEQAVALGLRLVGSYASGALSAGGPFDVVQVETVSSSDPGSTSILTSGRSILERTRLGVGGQLGEKTFYTVSAGFCGLGLGGQQDLTLFRRGLGFKIEHRLTSTLSVQASFEPGSVNQACNNTSFLSSVLQTPKQGGFDFLRIWSF